MRSHINPAISLESTKQPVSDNERIAQKWCMCVFGGRSWGQEWGMWMGFFFSYVLVKHKSLANGD